MKLIRWILVVLVLAVVGIQFVPVERTNPPVVSEVSAPGEVAAVLERACYDCHSNETKWPWYSYVAPASWFVTNHVEHARGDLNFSEWPTLDLELQEHAYHDIDEQVSEGKMPLESYTWMHRDAQLSEDERQLIVRWARSRSLGGSGESRDSDSEEEDDDG